MQDFAGKVEMNSEAAHSCRPSHMDEQRRENQLERRFKSTVSIQDEDSRERWTIETCGEKGPGKSILASCHDYDDDDLFGWK